MPDGEEHVRVRVNDGTTIVRCAENNQRYTAGDVIPEMPASEAAWLNEGHDRVTILEYLSGAGSTSDSVEPGDPGYIPSKDTDTATVTTSSTNDFDDASTDFEQLDDVGQTYAQRLHEAGYGTIGDLRAASVAALEDVPDVPDRVAASIKAQVN